MKKRRFYRITICLLLLLSIGMLSFSLFLRSDLFYRIHDRNLRNRYLATAQDREDKDAFYWYTKSDFRGCINGWDICAVVKVTEGMEKSLGDDWTGNPKDIWKASYTPIEVEVEEYLYDKTENYFERLTIRAQTWRNEWERLYAYSGERLILFIGVIGSGLCQTSTMWGYIIAEGDYLVPLVDICCEAMNEYGARKKNVYLQDVREAWEEYDLKRKLATVVYDSIMKFSGEIDRTRDKYAYSYQIIKKKEKNDQTLQVALTFAVHPYDKERCLEEVKTKEGILELTLQKEEEKYRVLSESGIWKEELETQPETKLSWVTKEDLDEIEYFREKSSEELEGELSQWMIQLGIQEQKQEEYERFAIWHDKLEKRKEEKKEKKEKEEKEEKESIE